MKEAEFVVLENGIEYVILAEKIIDNINYVYLLNSNDSKDYVIRKSVDGELIGLSDNKEFDKVMMILVSEYLKNTKNN